jgi:hypothetical protein
MSEPLIRPAHRHGTKRDREGYVGSGQAMCRCGLCAGLEVDGGEREQQELAGLFELELDKLPLIKGLVALTENLGVMNKDISAFGVLNKAISLGIIEAFDSALLFLCHGETSSWGFLFGERCSSNPWAV